MWVFTPFGFFSAVSHRDKPGYVMVRARVRDDLVQLIERTGFKVKIISTPAADYPYRVTMTKRLFAELVAEFIKEDLTYPNFKSTVPDRASVYHDVWYDLHGLEEPRD